MAEATGLERLDGIINRLIERDQTGDAIDPMDIARELGQVRALLMGSPTVHRTADDLRHFRCESCGTISHGDGTPATCRRCGKNKFVNVDIA